LNHLLVGPGLQEPEVRTHEYLQEVAIELARYTAGLHCFLTLSTFINVVSLNCSYVNIITLVGHCPVAVIVSFWNFCYSHMYYIFSLTTVQMWHHFIALITVALCKFNNFSYYPVVKDNWSWIWAPC